ncbi:phosphoribosylanthranilate isomerase [bacterium]|nr:phosphoribosylanthranilate isomerase [bacterium]
MHRTKVKICGITSKEQAIEISRLGADAIGFILYPPSPRYIEPEKVKQIICAIPPFVKTVGVFVNENPEKLISIKHSTGLDLIQLSGDETADYTRDLEENSIPIIKAFRIKNKSDLKNLEFFPATTFLLDAWSDKEYGGTGKTFDWRLLAEIKQKYEIILAGGLNPENIKQAIHSVQPYGVDISSGVEEKPGIKSIEKLKLLFERIKEADLSLNF